MSIRQSYTIAHGGRYPLGAVGRLGKIKLVAITVNGKAIRYATHLTYSESGTPCRYYIEVKRTDNPHCCGMLMVNKDDRLIETFIAHDQFFDEVVVTLEIEEAAGS